MVEHFLDLFLVGPNSPLALWMLGIRVCLSDLPAIRIIDLARIDTVPSPPHVERPKLSLQPGGLVGTSDPTIAARDFVAVPQCDVEIVIHGIGDGCLQCMVSSTENANGMWPDVFCWRKCLDSLHVGCPLNLVDIFLLCQICSGLVIKIQCARFHHCHLCNLLLDFHDCGFGDDRPYQFVTTTQNFKRQCARRLASVATVRHRHGSCFVWPTKQQPWRYDGLSQS
mmetsp:Transcript_6650/g.11340  ORF Transcript_6650/g.11340 Transcript_6650/m.11340 type:complete len:225 (+) Transcript_6650:1437-2111(+)